VPTITTTIICMARIILSSWETRDYGQKKSSEKATL